jgi:PBP1b-binding outer membrane lipoprotein LpoB
MSWQNNQHRLRVIISAAVLGLLLSGCSSVYYDRIETVALHADDAVATNRIVQMVDPWPPVSSNKNIAFNGDKMQTAVERYRTNKVIPPVNATTSSVQYQQAQQAANIAVNTGAATGQAAPAAPVK